MKKLIIITCCTLAFASCKKKMDDVSHVVTASFPTITITGDLFYSIPIGGTIPTVQATAYDSFLHESYTPQLDASGIDNTTPGLYVVPVVATNKNGYVNSTVVYIGVTDVDPGFDLSGDYVRAATGYTITVNELANGLYVTSNFFGVTGLDANAYFVQIDDSTIDVPAQPTDLGALEVSSSFLTTDPGDTTFGFVLQTLTTNRTLRVFEKQ